MELLGQIAALFQKGGLVMYPLLACSIMVIAIVIERWQYYRTAETSDEFLALLEKKLGEDQWQEAMALCEKTSGITPRIILKVLQKGVLDPALLQNALEGAAALATARLRDRLSYLETIVTLAPLLGLLGTVIGMINSFSIMAIRSGQPHAITGGVGEALVATAAGLCVAVMALVAHSYFAQRLDRIITGMEMAFTCLLDAAGRRKVG
ncbi:MotA/TolQ/ExbB proton channel family protein [Sporolituus thermophilus]|uniref:Outer membrane transport energization protein ExbB n=1 Tax=Sporolituus thermophilus DSM 23256 TaxID=1123285 RepID=A0A1G7LS04_9FIRM|nr:MotA/TolQ/ExbB proton channel family protein [Sporolituus thermophilus]SDF51749.1 outer membrane transport energization protein ExbB [Sporolituus thermophilus DSM 23256]